MTRVLIVDDHPILRESLRYYLDRQPDLAVCGEAATAAAALAAVAEQEPDLVLVDVSLPDMDGVSLVRELREHHPQLICVMLSGHGEPHYVTRASEAGARGYVLKGNAAEIPAVIRQVLAQ
jgi:DNA-binding NarL/FixJ family response regulator